MSVTIVQVKRRSEQGMTHPFLCAGDDGKWYWAKGNGAGKAALCYEWLAGRIAQEFGLPIPPFVQAVVPPDLIKYGALPDIVELGAGTVFASENMEGAEEFTLANMRHVPGDLRRKILVFDWLVQNQDRALGEGGGNVNILFLPRDSTIRIIDHNIAFDPDFDLSRLRGDHVSRSAIGDWEQDFVLDIGKQVDGIAGRLSAFFAELPDEWTETAALFPGFSLDRIQKVIERAGSAGGLLCGATL